MTQNIHLKVFFFFYEQKTRSVSFVADTFCEMKPSSLYMRNPSNVHKAN